MVCEHCVKDHDIDLSDYDEYPLGECSICGAVNEDARIEYEDWSAFIGLT